MQTKKQKIPTSILNNLKTKSAYYLAKQANNAYQYKPDGHLITK